jgi:RNA polymerase sigma-70 factor (ECF subfamily)
MTMPATADRTTTESSPAITAAAFEDFYRAHHREVYAAMWLVTRNRHEAEEITQDAFLRLLERWDRISVMEDATGYLFRTAMNVWRSRRRRAAVALRRMMRSPEQTSDLEEAESRADVIRLLSSLSERQRAALVLVDLIGLSSQDAAAALGLRPSTVRVQAARARAALREGIARHD